jgi:hypothetical protein
MKYGIRTPSPKRSFSARTTGRMNRAVKKAINPLYGKKGVGVIHDPQKAAYNKIYNRTSVGLSDMKKPHSASLEQAAPSSSAEEFSRQSGREIKFLQIVGLIFYIIAGCLFLLFFQENILLKLVGAFLAPSFFSVGFLLRILTKSL